MKSEKLTSVRISFQGPSASDDSRFHPRGRMKLTMFTSFQPIYGITTRRESPEECAFHLGSGLKSTLLLAFHVYLWHHLRMKCIICLECDICNASSSRNLHLRFNFVVNLSEL